MKDNHIYYPESGWYWKYVLWVMIVGWGISKFVELLT